MDRDLDRHLTLEGTQPRLDIDKAAAYLGVTPRWLRRQWAERRIAGYRLGRLVRFSVADLDDFIAQRRVEALR